MGQHGASVTDSYFLSKESKKKKGVGKPLQRSARKSLPAACVSPLGITNNTRNNRYEMSSVGGLVACGSSASRSCPIRKLKKAVLRTAWRGLSWPRTQLGRVENLCKENLLRHWKAVRKRNVDGKTLADNRKVVLTGSTCMKGLSVLLERQPKRRVVSSR